jgi:NADPH:quinone reductase-like Zn-dependent oxidoreductase
VKALGADKVIDYTREDFSKNGETYDVIMDTVNILPYRKMLNALSTNGILILSAAELPEMIKGAWTSMTGKRKVLTGVISEKAEDINFLKSLIETGRYKPVIDKTFPLERMAEAHAYAELGHKKGNVSITVGQD